MIAVALALLAAVCVIAAVRLSRARWPWRDPRRGILLWQALGLCWGLATTGALLAFGLAPYGGSVASGLVVFVSRPGHLPVPRHLSVLAGLALLGVLVGVLLIATGEVTRARRRHRMLLSLVGRLDPGVPGDVLVLDRPEAAAYCVPGLRSHVVVSAGALRLLDSSELAAVLAHEQAHARERHDLVLLPFAALRLAMPWSRVVGDAVSAVGLLVEMCADDRAGRSSARRPLAMALLRFGTAGTLPTPAGALGLEDRPNDVLARVNRLLHPGSVLPRRLRIAILATAAALAIAGPILWLIPG